VLAQQQKNPLLRNNALVLQKKEPDARIEQPIQTDVVIYINTLNKKK
jgi:hypothetical protein